MTNTVANVDMMEGFLDCDVSSVIALDACYV
jgi:hypothetical protein